MCVSIHPPSFLSGYDEKPAVIHSILAIYFSGGSHIRTAYQFKGTAVNPAFSAKILQVWY